MKGTLKQIKLKHAAVVLLMLLAVIFFFVFREKLYIYQTYDYNDLSGEVKELSASGMVEQTFTAEGDISEVSLLMSNNGREGAVLHAELCLEDGTCVSACDAVIPDSQGEEAVVSLPFSAASFAKRASAILRLSVAGDTEGIHYSVQEGSYQESMTSRGETTGCRLRMTVRYQDVNRMMAVLFPLMALIVLAFFLIPVKWQKIENLFAVLSISFGVFFAFINPPLQECDGIMHLYRSIDVSYGNVLAPYTVVNRDYGTAYIPENLDWDILRQLTPNTNAGGGYVSLLQSEPFSKELKEMPFYDNTAAFSYFPQAAGLVIGRLFHLSIYGSIVLGRLFNLLTFVIIVYFAIKKMPVYKTFMTVLALMPMTLYQAASFSQDAVLNALMFLFIALCCYYAFGERRALSWKQMLPLGFLLLGMFLIKYVYVCLGLLVFIIPKNKFASKRAYWKAFVIALLPLLLLGGYHMITAASGISGLQAVAEEPGAAGAGMTQTDYLLAHPLYFAKVLKTTFMLMTSYYLQSLYVLGSLNCGLDMLYVLGPCFLVGVALLDAGRGNNINSEAYSRKNRIVFFLAFLITFLMIFLGLYIADSVANPVSAGVVAGIQGRYFIPLFPLLFMAFHSKKVDCKIKQFELKVCGINAVMLLYASWVVYKVYY